MNKNMSYKAISIVFSVLTVCFLMVFYSLAWTDPSGIPPSNNVSTPINVGSVAQIKSGPLRIGGVFRTDSATYLGVGGGNVGIGTTIPSSEKLSVSGNIRATGTICDSNGCIGGGSGGGAPTITSYCNVSTYPNCTYTVFSLTGTSIGQHDVCFLQSFAETKSTDRDWCIVRNNGSDWTVTRRYAHCIVTCLDW